jgi:hypothetical protein
VTRLRSWYRGAIADADERLVELPRRRVALEVALCAAAGWVFTVALGSLGDHAFQDVAADGIGVGIAAAVFYGVAAWRVRSRARP